MVKRKSRANADLIFLQCLLADVYTKTFPWELFLLRAASNYRPADYFGPDGLYLINKSVNIVSQAQISPVPLYCVSDWETSGQCKTRVAL